MSSYRKTPPAWKIIEQDRTHIVQQSFWRISHWYALQLRQYDGIVPRQGCLVQVMHRKKRFQEHQMIRAYWFDTRDEALTAAYKLKTLHDMGLPLELER